MLMLRYNQDCGVFFFSFFHIATPGGGGVLLEILGGGVPPGSSNPDPISDQKNVIFHIRFQTRPLKSIPVFRPGFRQKLCYHYIDCSAIIQIPFEFAYFSFFPNSFAEWKR